MKLDCTGQQISSSEYWALHPLENETKFRVEEERIFNRAVEVHEGMTTGKKK